MLDNVMMYESYQYLGKYAQRWRDKQRSLFHTRACSDVSEGNESHHQLPKPKPLVAVMAFDQGKAYLIHHTFRSAIYRRKSITLYIVESPGCFFTSI